MYAPAESIETPLTESEIEAFRALCTSYPTTTVLNGSRAHMAVKYGIDTKTCIDSVSANGIKTKGAKKHE